MFDRRKIEREIIDYLSGWDSGFDIDGIIDDLRDMEVTSVDEVEPDEFTEILQCNEL